MYLHCLDIHCCRCSFLDQCICNLLFFEPADAFSLPGMYNCIYILPFLGFKDTPFANFASTSHVFDNVKMLSIKILHLQYPKIHYRRYLSPYPLSCYLLHKLSRYITYKKIDTKIARTFYGTGDFQYSFFKTLHIFLQSQEIPFREKL